MCRHRTVGEIAKGLSFRSLWGIFSSTVISFKILINFFYWKGMFKDSYTYVKNCEKCHLFTGCPQLAMLPLKPIVIDEPFQQWGIDFIGILNPPSSVGHNYILIAMDYFTKWVEAIPTKKENS